ncbi:MAG: AraC family transcriptional regulator [Oscillospiraceae bacterium]|nr:AraC family transcriptional regulator [Oscillospiraceae bacterium]
MNDIVEDCYNPMFSEHGFLPVTENHQYGQMGSCLKLSEKIGAGFYWIYGQKDLFDIKIHDFFFHEDSFMEFKIPECLSITHYESISGEELSPYRRLNAGCVKSYMGGYEPYKVLIHKKIPIRCVGIEVMPAYYENHLRNQYPGEYANPREAFCQVGQTMDFPEMVHLLSQVKNYRGEGIAAKLFYEGKVAEAISLVLARKREKKPESSASLSRQDTRQIEIVNAYLNDHYAYDVPLDRLAKIACMGTTKLKSTFRQYHGCTITEYIQNRRMGQAEHLLSDTDLTIGQVAQAVGYASAGRFAELFCKSTGLLPREYRKMARR